jgi:site-specific DNA recombinase
MSKRAVIVARVSTEGQGQRGFSITTQLEAMRAYCAAAGLIVAHELQDVISGTKPLRDRPGGAAMIRIIETGEFEAVVFYAVDRVTRDDDVIELATLRRDVKRAGIELHYANEGGKADLSALGGIIDNVRATLAAEERKKIIERSVRGRRGKAAAGRWVGQGDTPRLPTGNMGRIRGWNKDRKPKRSASLPSMLALSPLPIRTMTE